MKKLNITKEAFNKSRYFQNKYGTLKYVSESGKVFKTDKGHLIKFKESDENKNHIESELDELSKLVKCEEITLESVVKKLKRMGFTLVEYGGGEYGTDYSTYAHKYGFVVNIEYHYKHNAYDEDCKPSDFYWYEDLKFIMANWPNIINHR